MDDTAIRELGEDLLRAYADGPVEPPSQTRPELDLDGAYAVQQVQVAQWTADGRRVVGHKVGLTSAAMQRQLGVDQPDYGVLFGDMCFDDGGTVDIGRFLQPRIEPEIAFVLEHDLVGPGVTAAAALRAVAFVLPALEIIDSRVRDWRIGILDTVADNASCGGLVLGSRPTSVHACDLRLVGANLTANGELRGTGAGGAVLGSPLVALVWLANVLGARGVPLRAGDVVLPGSVMSAQPVVAGQSWTAQFATLGSVSLTFTGATA